MHLYKKDYFILISVCYILETLYYNIGYLYITDTKEKKEKYKRERKRAVLGFLFGVAN